jgi:predicted nucleic acid-binding protein
MSKQSRLFVVDASVMRSAGMKEGHSAACTGLLNAILSICHRAVITEDIQMEWNTHQSLAAKKWRSAMASRRKLVKLDVLERENFNEKVNECVPRENVKDRRELLKDAHLLAAAYGADRLLLTADSKLQGLCEKHSIDQNIEWLTVKYAHDTHKDLLDRMADLATNRPNPPLPKKS